MTVSTAAAPSRPLDLATLAVVVMLCASWGLQQVGIKLAIADVPAVTQMAVRSAGGALLMFGFALARGVRLREPDRTLVPGVLLGLVFSVEFILIYVGLSLTTASRSVLFIYTSPFFVALGAMLLLPGERLSATQWAGLALSFAGVVAALGLPSGNVTLWTLVGDLCCLGGGILWAISTLIIRMTPLRQAPFEKVTLYQLSISAVMAAAAAWLFGERVTAMPSAATVGWIAYQVIWVAFVTFLLWFRLLVRHPVAPLQAATSMTPLFGVLFGVVVLGEPMSPGFALAVALVVAGLALVSGVVGRRR